MPRLPAGAAVVAKFGLYRGCHRAKVHGRLTSRAIVINSADQRVGCLLDRVNVKAEPAAEHPVRAAYEAGREEGEEAPDLSAAQPEAGNPEQT